MKINIKTLILTGLLAIGIGGGLGFYVAAFNGFITDFFASPHYQTAAQIHRYVIGITIGYGLLFGLASVALIFIKIRKGVPIFYPLAGLVGLAIASWFRFLGGSLSTIDCGNDCVDTMVPQSAQELATKLVTWTLIIIYVLCVALYFAKLRLRPHSS